jgi:mannose-6-phosphate isomerase-like protein (cupin superfamily)
MQTTDTHSINYQSLVGVPQGARRLHIHRTMIHDTAAHTPYQHEHAAEEVFYILEGRATYRFGGKTIVAGPGDTAFIPSGIRHAEIEYHTPSMTYLTIRTVEPNDEPCCCGQDRVIEAENTTGTLT